MSTSILTHIIRAQDAFQQSTAKYADIDTTDILLKADSFIRDAIGKGFLGGQVGGILDHLTAEKAALQLAELGYSATVVQTGVALVEGGAPGATRPVLGINLNWKYMPQNQRDGFSL